MVIDSGISMKASTNTMKSHGWLAAVAASWRSSSGGSMLNDIRHMTPNLTPKPIDATASSTQFIRENSFDSTRSVSSGSMAERRDNILLSDIR